MDVVETLNPKPSLRDAQRALTRHRICDAAAHLFCERGYAAVTMEEIALEARVSRSTLYVHYPDKVDLSAEIALAYGKTLCTHVARLAGPTPSRAQIHEWLKELAVILAQEHVPTTLIRDLSSRGEAPTAMRLISEQLMAALAARVPAFSQNLENGARRDHAHAWAEAAMREVGWACQRVVGESKAAAAARLAVAAEIFERFIQAQGEIE